MRTIKIAAMFSALLAVALGDKRVLAVSTTGGANNGSRALSAAILLNA